MLPYHYGLVLNKSPPEEVREKCNKALAYYEKLLGDSDQGFFGGEMDFLSIILHHVGNRNTKYTYILNILISKACDILFFN